jgi:hypothetical protein
VEIRTTDRRLYSCTPEGVPGDPDHPVSDVMLQAKFRDCLSFSATAMARQTVERAIAMISDLENIPDVAHIVRLLHPQPA